MKIFLIRHGETDWTTAGKYCGHHDIPLNEIGKEQARQAGLQLLNEPLSAVFSSPLTRAKETAEIALAVAQHHHLPIQEIPELKEIHFGVLSGFTYEQALERHADWYSQWLNNPFATTPPGGESFTDFSTRVLRSWEQILTSGADSVAVFSHGGAIRILMAHHQGIPLNQSRDIRQDPGQVNIIEVNS